MDYGFKCLKAGFPQEVRLMRKLCEAGAQLYICGVKDPHKPEEKYQNFGNEVEARMAENGTSPGSVKPSKIR
jgi:hypothetical protein